MESSRKTFAFWTASFSAGVENLRVSAEETPIL